MQYETFLGQLNFRKSYRLAKYITSVAFQHLSNRSVDIANSNTCMPLLYSSTGGTEQECIGGHSQPLGI